MDEFKMTSEQRKLLDALKPLQRKVALNVVAGLSNIDSYYEAGGKAKTKESAEATVSELLSNPKVKAFLDSMKAAAVSDAVMSRERMLELQSQIADIDSARMANMSLEELSELKGALDIKLKAMNQLADLAGYKAASKHELSNPDGSLRQKPSVIQLVAPKADK